MRCAIPPSNPDVQGVGLSTAARPLLSIAVARRISGIPARFVGGEFIICRRRPCSSAHPPLARAPHCFRLRRWLFVGQGRICAKVARVNRRDRTMAWCVAKHFGPDELLYGLNVATKIDPGIVVPLPDARRRRQTTLGEFSSRRRRTA